MKNQLIDLTWGAFLGIGLMILLTVPSIHSLINLAAAVFLCWVWKESEYTA